MLFEALTRGKRIHTHRLLSATCRMGTEIGTLTRPADFLGCLDFSQIHENKSESDERELDVTLTVGLCVTSQDTLTTLCSENFAPSFCNELTDINLESCSFHNRLECEEDDQKSEDSKDEIEGVSEFTKDISSVTVKCPEFKNIIKMIEGKSASCRNSKENALWKKWERCKKNRESAQNSRKRKKEYVEQIENEKAELAVENKDLKSKLKNALLEIERLKGVGMGEVLPQTNN